MTESEVRKLRDKVFERPISDNEWQDCKHNWLKPEEIQWLLALTTQAQL